MCEVECDRCGDTFDKRGFPFHKKHCDAELAERIERLYHEENMSVSEVAEEIGYHPESLRRKMKKEGIERRSRGEGQRLKYQHEVTLWWGNNGRLYLRVCEYGEQYDFLHSRISMLPNHSIKEINENHVHHKNKHPADDRPVNLELVDSSEHLKGHWESGDMKLPHE